MNEEEYYSETLYVKRGDQYVPWGNTESLTTDRHGMKAGTFRLIQCSGDGAYRIRTDVTPDTAGFIAAATIAQDAMEKALIKASLIAPKVNTPLTTKQREILNNFKDQMRKAGGIFPHYWEVNSPNEIATAGINAVLEQLLMGGGGE